MNRRADIAGRAGFTLIELLVVIGIISLLMSMLMPSMSRARQQAKAVVCLARMNEIMKATFAYGGDYQFALPPIQYEVKDHPGVYHGWAEALHESLYQEHDFAFDRNYPVMQNLGGRYKFFTCTEGEPRENSSGHYRVYELSWSLGTLDRVRARLPLLTDANPVVTDPNDLLRADIPREHIAGLEGEAYIDERHYGGANYAFSDGHAERSLRLKEDLAEDWDLDPRTPNR